MKQDDKTGEIFYSMGFALGKAIEKAVETSDEEPKEPNVYLNNHYQIYLDYHRRDDGKLRVVGVVVWPMR